MTDIQQITKLPTELPHYDIAIVGGGLAGASMALALAPLPLSIALIDSVPAAKQVQASYDARSVALAHSSCQIYQALKVLPAIQQQGEAITKVHVSEQGQFGFTRISARELELSALGYVIEIPQLLFILSQALASATNVTRIAPATVASVAQVTPHQQRLQLTDHTPLTASLVIAADGVHSPLRQQLGWPVKQMDYHQHAFVANLTLNRPHNNVAYERFTPQGPLALLPLHEKMMTLVCTVPTEQLAFMRGLPDREFLAFLRQQLGYRVGRFEKIGQRTTFPLQLLQATQQYQPGIVALGNAAHNLHPIAAQGFNLGLRDVACLAQVLTTACQKQQAISDETLLQEYWQLRQQDQQKTIRFSHGLVSLFMTEFPGIRFARNMGMLGLDMLPMGKPWFARYGMGSAGYAKRLARGLRDE